jgi:hypothetical protein
MPPTPEKPRRPSARKRGSPEGPKRGKRPRPAPGQAGRQVSRESAPRGTRDPLGRILKEYKVTWAGVLVVCGGIALLGGGVLAFALTREVVSIALTSVGGAICFSAVALFLMNLGNVGRCLELRKRGVRFTERGLAVEMLWSDVVDVDVNRTDQTNLGVAAVLKQSSDYAAPTGPLGKTEFEIRINAADGRSIRLSPMFMRMVSDPRELISFLKIRSGI